MSRPRRLVLFTGTHLNYVTKILEPLLQEYGHEVIHVFVSRSLFDFKFLKKRAAFFLRNRYPFCIRWDDWLRFISWTWFNRKNQHGHRSVPQFIQSFGIPCSYINEIHMPATLNQLKELDGELFLMCLFDKVAKQPFLDIPKLGTYNVHMGKLPEHRGGLTAFWVLRFGDTQAGTSLHKAVAKLDAGELIEEVRFPVTTNSMKKLMDITVEQTAIMIIRGVDRIFAQEAIPIDTTGRPDAYFLLPSWKDFKEFYARGCRLV